MNVEGVRRRVILAERGVRDSVSHIDIFYFDPSWGMYLAGYGARKDVDELGRAITPLFGDLDDLVDAQRSLYKSLAGSDRVLMTEQNKNELWGLALHMGQRDDRFSPDEPPVVKSYLREMGLVFKDFVRDMKQRGGIVNPSFDDDPLEWMKEVAQRRKISYPDAVLIWEVLESARNAKIAILTEDKGIVQWLYDNAVEISPMIQVLQSSSDYRLRPVDDVILCEEAIVDAKNTLRQIPVASILFQGQGYVAPLVRTV